MAEVSYKGKTFEVDEDGFLLRFDDWCPEWLEYVNESEGISEITPDHQKVLDFLQDYNSLAKQYQALHRKYETPGKPTHKDGVWHCPACNCRVQINHSHCHRCGKRLGWR